jgi:hypothetical protein
VTLQSGIEKQTLDATWQSSDLNAAIVSETGLLEVTGFGEVNISATLQEVTATSHISLPLPPAPVARLDVTIDSHGSPVAIADATEVAFDMSKSTGFRLRYDLQFGDGVSSSEATVRHIYGATGRFLVRATVTDAVGRTDTISHTVSAAFFVDAAQPYGWSVSVPKGQLINPRLYLQFDRPPDGRNVSGMYKNSGHLRLALQLAGHAHLDRQRRRRGRNDADLSPV